MQALHGMHLLDAFNLVDVQAFHSRFTLEEPLTEVINALNNFHIPNEEAHNQLVDEGYTTR